MDAMDARAAKLALARQKLKSHQEKKLSSSNRDENNTEEINHNDTQPTRTPPDNQFVEPAVNVDVPDKAPPAANVLQNVQETIPTFDYTNQHNNAGTDVNVTEILIASKRNLELQVNELQTRLAQLENNYTLATNNNSYCKQQISNLEYELKSLHERYLKASEENTIKEKIISELNNAKTSICDENNNLLEQLEFTKSMLTAKESENAALNNQVINLQTQLDATQLQLQQITSGAQGILATQRNDNPDQNPEVLQQKITFLEQQLKSIKKERDQLSSHYEQFLGELNEQLKVTASKNNELQLKVENLSVRENSLVEQISEMEIRLQNMKQQQQPLERHEVINQDIQAKHDAELNALQHKYDNIQEQLQAICKKYDELQVKYAESEAKVETLSQAKQTECEHDNISISKLTADIASDKLAAQRATEQNRKLKVDVQELEEAFVKISKDKLELTEKVAAEKFLNRELTIKLADAEERAKDLQTKLRAKDEEMIRLQNSYRELERKLDTIPGRESKDSEEVNGVHEHITENDTNHVHDHNHDNCKHQHQTEEAEPEACQHTHDMEEEYHCLTEKDDNSKIPKQDAMMKLQDRFLKIMDEVANLSDEKHRLEHIILQLQNETDTICEYVALYQQQRSLLKKRDEERSAQIKIFQAECDLLKSQLEELSGIIIRLAQDSELAVYFQTEPRHSDLAKPEPGSDFGHGLSKPGSVPLRS
ncbi:putative golgin subfamily A member 2-like protein 5 domain-containing protein [Phthorimaea operculella]|nr:putative golgin subfamily A member 2-like protein 5 domain-containing protein [Phthorimaea operculella]